MIKKLDRIKSVVDMISHNLDNNIPTKHSDLVPSTIVDLRISHEEVQNLSVMKDDQVFEHLRDWYAIDTSRIISISTIFEKTMTYAILKLKIKLKIKTKN